MASIRELRSRIRAVQSTRKITKAQELIATSRITKAQARVNASKPYAEEMTSVLTELASRSGTLDHPLLSKLGPEPLSEDFSVDYLMRRARYVRRNIKTFLMDAEIVVGVGNIYANEALFYAGIRPLTEAGKGRRARMARLVPAVKMVLAKAIDAGGTSLRDFLREDGKPGYFRHELQVYGREGEACYACEGPLTSLRISNRATVYCRRCQR